MPRSERQRVVVACQRLGVAAKTGQAPAAIKVHGSACGVVRQDIVKCGERVLVALERIEDHSIIDQSIGRSGLRLQRGGDQAQALDRAALLMPQNATQMQGIEIVRIRREHGIVDLSGLVEPSLLMQRQRLLDGVGRAQRLRSRLIGHAWITRRSFWPRPDMLLQWRTQRAACHPAFELFFEDRTTWLTKGKGFSSTLGINRARS